MHTISPARLKPGITLDDLPSTPAGGSTPDAARVVRGRALIFWDA